MRTDVHENGGKRKYEGKEGEGRGQYRSGRSEEVLMIHGMGYGGLPEAGWG